MREKKRRRWTAAEKLRIVLTCMQPGVEVSEVCRREGINPTMFYTCGVAAAGPRGGGVNEGTKRLAGGEDTGGVGSEPDDLLPLAS